MRSAKELLHGGLSRLRQRFARPPGDPMPEVIQQIDAAQENSRLGLMAEEFLMDPFTESFMDFIDAQVEEAHQKLLDHKIGGETYAELYQLIAKVAGYPHSIVGYGKAARERLEQWQADGTLREAELYRATAKEQ